ncbi:MAG: hypothetical protein HXY43_01480 [Fischerella sp.]|jgi:hypothetical protein|uniref:hormogonium polysaccharide biosynthesis protein HpsA n=1 Tax=Fischerella sp. TaxID=1191 RepID=UPI00181F7CE2|nr:hormogonium polysaccharide biosynthesis protein HpsA [Fischerella sp.]NWF58007.1 hypothetical protein [Fischerella sp.]
MYLNSKLVKVIRKYCQTLCQQSQSTIKEQLLWFVRIYFLTRRQTDWVNSGFVLPTVAMVSLVVVLLTTAILFRSFERSKNASNVRVNEVVLKAATPALERAKAKISELFADPTLPRAVPSNATLYNTLFSKRNVYTLGDETPLTLAYDLDKDKDIESPTSGTLEEKEILQTAWKFPVDTDNNGKFDSFTLYAVYFRNPPYIGANPARQRSPLDGRTAPLSSNACDAAGETSASLVGSSGWYKTPTGELKKSFFVYAVTVPITNKGSLGDSYEEFKGNRGFSAIEMQQDRIQLPITNNAVVYEDDLDITPGPQFYLNGRIFTNSNFFTGESFQDIRLFQVSSFKSCYYERENSKIIVGGNVATNSAIAGSNNYKSPTEIDLFDENNLPTKKQLESKHASSNTNGPNQVAYNSQAYAERIDLLVKAQFARNKDYDPQEVKDSIARRIASDPNLDPDKVRREELEIYFRKRTRRVPFNEVPFGTSGIGSYDETNVLQGTDITDSNNNSNNKLRPPDAWIYPTDTNTTLTLKTTNLPATDPEVVETTPVKENEIGDRILAGNNLPELRWDNTKQEFVGENNPQEITGVKWNSSKKTRTRTTRVKQLADLGVTGRDGFWENAAASPRADNLDVVGGLRVITGAGVYMSMGSLLPLPPQPADNPNTPEKEDKAPVVWSDAMPMLVPDPSNPSNTSRGHLVMRATAVYHYNDDPYTPQTKATDTQTPIACVSSYYNPTNANTIVNGTMAQVNAGTHSNNGVSYAVSSTTAKDITRGQTTNSDGLFTIASGAEDVTNTGVSLIERLKYQANLVFPNGQFVNPLLRQALKKATTKPLTLSEQSALDSSICAIQIADGTLSTNSSVIPNDAIKETAFLDARQIKAIDKGTPTGKYDLEIEQRQPLEIRATVIDLDKLRKKSITGTWSKEYLLPNSGIIYASRDDARADRSDPSSSNVSATDYKLDPNRRPNAIMLINGKDISRENDYRPEEKGLILATDLPAYIKGDFNLHTKQEFKGSDFLSSPDDWTTGTDPNIKFYTRSDRDPDFACRPKDPRLPKCSTGETWRPASVLADAVTVLSNNFQEGFRDDGDYDLRNNQTDTSDAADVSSTRLKNGFWDNNFVTSRNFTDADYSGSSGSPPNSSYFNNFVTPIQRRVSFPEYVMEMCLKIPVSECTKPEDWVVGYDGDLSKHSWELPLGAERNKLMAGTTASSATGYERYPRRVAFKRNSSGELVDTYDNVIDPNNITNPPIALGIKSSKIDSSGFPPDKANNALWFTTVNSSDTANPPTQKVYTNTTRLFYSFPTGADAKHQPLLEPILQIHVLNKNPNKDIKDTTTYLNLVELGTDLKPQSKKDRVKYTRWLAKATETTFNLVIAAGDTPTRVGNTSNPYYENNGGLHNFVRFIESWDNGGASGASDPINANITGSFIQFKRSIFATAPFQVFTRPGANDNPNVKSLFSERQGVYYNTDSTGYGEAPFYMAPKRNWGFDVALLSQNPDLFAQRFVIPNTDPPNEYYREVPRDDRWVQTLLCAVQETEEDDTSKNSFDTGFNIKIYDSTNKTTTTTSTKYALPASERPSTCPVTPN